VQFTQTTKIAVTGCPSAKPKITILKAKAKGKALMVTVQTSKTGTVKIAGAGLKTTTKRGVKAGSHRIRVPFKASGLAAAKRHARIKARASLTVGSQSATSTKSVRV
jgi:hypothetical protein